MRLPLLLWPSLPRRLPQHCQPFLRRHFLQAFQQGGAGSAHVGAIVFREGLHQAHHRQGDRGRGHHLLRQHGGDLRGGLADGGMTVDLRMLRRIDQGEKVEAADGVKSQKLRDEILRGNGLRYQDGTQQWFVMAVRPPRDLPIAA